MATATAKLDGAESHSQIEEPQQQEQEQHHLPSEADEPSDAVSLAESNTDTLLPDYSDNSPRLPSYAHPTARQSMTKEERLASLQAFMERK